MIDQVHTINYKYMKNLALAVSDAISRLEGSVGYLEKAFKQKYPTLFAEADNLNLDSLVIMLMIEENPTRVLEVLFTGSQQLFYSIVENVDRRFDDQTLSFHGKSRRELEAKVDSLITHYLLSGEHRTLYIGKSEGKRKEEIARLRPNAQALMIVSSLLKLVEEERPNDYIYGGNIYSNIDSVRKLKSHTDVFAKIEYARNILVDTFKHLICFYEGVYAYGDSKAHYDLESMNTCLPHARIAAAQKKMLDDFINAAKARADQFASDPRYKTNDVFVYIDDFIQLCDRCRQPKTDNERSYRERLYAAVGKYEIVDMDAFMGCIHNGLGSHKIIDATNVDVWIDFALTMMEFFKTGSFRDTPIDHRLMDAVYPFAAAYSCRNENRDGQITVTFTISIDIDNNGSDDFRREINVLTEFDYNLQEMFYCLPNVQRSNERWWIDPLLISFTKFNSIFE